MRRMKQGKRIKAWQLVVIGLASACVSLAANICVAKMSEGVESGQGSLEVAKWDVSMTGANNGVDLVAGGGTRTYSLTVTNNSEVASRYEIEVSGVPDGVRVGLGDGDLQTPTSEGKVTFTENGGALNVNSSRPHSLVFAAGLDAGEVVDSDISVNVLFRQEEL